MLNSLSAVANSLSTADQLSRTESTALVNSGERKDLLAGAVVVVVSDDYLNISNHLLSTTHQHHVLSLLYHQEVLTGATSRQLGQVGR